MPAAYLIPTGRYVTVSRLLGEAILGQCRVYHASELAVLVLVEDEFTGALSFVEILVLERKKKKRVILYKVGTPVIVIYIAGYQYILIVYIYIL